MEIEITEGIDKIGTGETEEIEEDLIANQKVEAEVMTEEEKIGEEDLHLLPDLDYLDLNKNKKLVNF